MTDEHDAMNAAIRAAAGRTLPPEDEQDEETPARPGTANAGVRALPDEDGPDMDDLIRRAVSRSRYGHDGTQLKPLPR